MGDKHKGGLEGDKIVGREGNGNVWDKRRAEGQRFCYLLRMQFVDSPNDNGLLK